MPETVFRYPGGKCMLSPWIVDHFAEHKCYVEVFGGSGAVLLNKPESHVEVFNDLDGDIVQFFKVLRSKPDELVEWLRTLPYSRDLHREFGEDYYDGYRPDDDVERAGRFFYLRYSQFSGKYSGTSGFSSSKIRNTARKFANAREKLGGFAERFEHVQIENLDCIDALDRFDGENTLFYCDPPYVKEGDELYSHNGEFDHSSFVDALNGLEGKAVVSYTDLPTGLDDWHVEGHDVNYSMRRGQDDWEKDNTEHLAMNYNPNEEPAFSKAAQATLTDGGFCE